MQEKLENIFQNLKSPMHLHKGFGPIVQHLPYVCMCLRERAHLFYTPFSVKKKFINEAHFFLESSSNPTETLTHFSQLPLHFVIFNTPTRLLSYLVRYRGQSVKLRWQLIDTIFLAQPFFSKKLAIFLSNFCNLYHQTD